MLNERQLKIVDLLEQQPRTPGADESPNDFGKNH